MAIGTATGWSARAGGTRTQTSAESGQYVTEIRTSLRKHTTEIDAYPRASRCSQRSRASPSHPLHWQCTWNAEGLGISSNHARAGGKCGGCGPVVATPITWTSQYVLAAIRLAILPRIHCTYESAGQALGGRQLDFTGHSCAKLRANFCAESYGEAIRVEVLQWVVEVLEGHP